VETAGLEKAERECLEDADERAEARAHGAERRRKQDVELATQMTQKIATLFPGCPASEVTVIAEHTAQRGSGRVGRTEAGRNLAENALTLAVIAAIRHKHAPYDELLANGVDRVIARQKIADRVEEILARWRKWVRHISAFRASCRAVWLAISIERRRPIKRLARTLRGFTMLVEQQIAERQDRAKATPLKVLKRPEIGAFWELLLLSRFRGQYAGDL
jgi:hypothetical protein